MAAKRAIIYQNLSVMVQAGVPLLRSLRSVASAGRGQMQTVLLALAEEVASGHTLAEAMAGVGRVFEPLEIAAVEAGELSGNLAESLKQLSDWHDLLRRLKQIVVTGLLLPVLLLHVTAVVAPLIGFLLGSLSTAEYLIQVAETLALLYVPLALVLVVRQLKTLSTPLRTLLDAALLRVPWLGGAIRDLSLSRFCRAFHMLYTAGVPLVQATQRAAEASGNAVMNKRLGSTVESVRRGNLMSQGFSRRLPRDFLERWRIGEESGALDDTVRRLAETLAEQAQAKLVEFFKWLPRLVYVAVCLVMIMKIMQGAAQVMSHQAGVLKGLE